MLPVVAEGDGTMWCHRCGAEYTAGFLECADCGIPLAADPPTPKPASREGDGGPADADGEEPVEYDRSAWSQDRRRPLSFRLDTEQIPHTWRGGDLGAPKRRETEVDALVDEIDQVEEATFASDRPPPGSGTRRARWVVGVAVAAILVVASWAYATRERHVDVGYFVASEGSPCVATSGSEPFRNVPWDQVPGPTQQVNFASSGRDVGITVYASTAPPDLDRTTGLALTRVGGRRALVWGSTNRRSATILWRERQSWFQVGVQGTRTAADVARAQVATVTVTGVGHFAAVALDGYHRVRIPSMRQVAASIGTDTAVAAFACTTSARRTAALATWSYPRGRFGAPDGIAVTRAQVQGREATVWRSAPGEYAAILGLKNPQARAWLVRWRGPAGNVVLAGTTAASRREAVALVSSLRRVSRSAWIRSLGPRFERPSIPKLSGLGVLDSSPTFGLGGPSAAELALTPPVARGAVRAHDWALYVSTGPYVTSLDDGWHCISLRWRDGADGRSTSCSHAIFPNLHRPAAGVRNERVFEAGNPATGAVVVALVDENVARVRLVGVRGLLAEVTPTASLDGPVAAAGVVACKDVRTVEAVGGDGAVIGSYRPFCAPTG